MKIKRRNLHKFEDDLNRIKKKFGEVEKGDFEVGAPICKTDGKLKMGNVVKGWIRVPGARLPSPTQVQIHKCKKGKSVGNIHFHPQREKARPSTNDMCTTDENNESITCIESEKETKCFHISLSKRSREMCRDIEKLQDKLADLKERKREKWKAGKFEKAENISEEMVEVESHLFPLMKSFREDMGKKERMEI